jgi:hypothetical protein
VDGAPEQLEEVAKQRAEGRIVFDDQHARRGAWHGGS